MSYHKLTTQRMKVLQYVAEKQMTARFDFDAELRAMTGGAAKAKEALQWLTEHGYLHFTPFDENWTGYNNPDGYGMTDKGRAAVSNWEKR